MRVLQPSDFILSHTCSRTRKGTNTDSVLIDVTKSDDPEARGVVAAHKHVTTPDVTAGIEIAVKRVLEKANLASSPDKVLSLTIGTTVRSGFNVFIFPPGIN